MITDRQEERIAAEAVEEVLAFVDACLTTGEPTGAVLDTIVAVRRALQTVVQTVRSDHRPDLDLLASLTVAPGDPAGEHRARPGHSMAAALLRIARAVSRRALRELDAVEERNAALVVTHVTGLPALLDRLADQLDADEERAVPVAYDGSSTGGRTRATQSVARS